MLMVLVFITGLFAGAALTGAIFWRVAAPKPAATRVTGWVTAVNGGSVSMNLSRALALFPGDSVRVSRVDG
jgi:hypothetical protein